MSHDNHNNNGHSENKPVAFTTPLILGIVAIFVILCFVSLGNPCHNKCCEEGECKKECAEKCEKGEREGKHEEAKAEEHATETVAVETAAVVDSTKHEEPVKEEAHH